MKWLWLAIAGALGVWLIVLLTLSRREAPEARDAEKPATPFDQVGRKAKGFDAPAAKAFSDLERPAVKSSRPLTPFPAAPDQGKSE